MAALSDLADMLSFTEKRTSSAKLAEWSPSDWPESLREMRTIDNLLRCSICYEFFDVALITPECSHNYCSLCIRRSLSYDTKTKLLELTTNTVQVTSLQSGDKKGGEAKNEKSINTSKKNIKRRKCFILNAQSSSQNNTTSTSPDTKRQKLDAENEQDLILVEVAENDKEENSSRQSTPEVAVIEMEKQVQEPQPSEPQSSETQPSESQPSEPQPVIISEHRSDERQPSQPQDPELAECPVCGDMILHRKINSHLDACLNRTEKKSSLRMKKSSEPSTSKSSKHKSPVNVGLQDSPACSSSEPGSSTTEQEVSFAAVSSNMTIKGSNALIRMIQRRKPLPKLVYNVMSDKELLKRLKEWNLSTKGNRTTLIKRHQEFVMLYNSQCDSEKPMTAAQIVREVEKAELTKEREAASVAEAPTSHGVHFTKDQSEKEMDQVRQEYLNQHKNEFEKLIADMQKRKKGQRNKSAKKTPESESLEALKTDPTDEDVDKIDQDKSDTYEQEIMESRKISQSSDQTYPPFFRKSTAAPALSKDGNSRTSSVIPEPPSSPSLVSLEEDEPGTPSLGLEDDDWDLKDEESEDPSVIPESPVIKVGSKTADERTDKDTDSDEECQQTFFKNKKVKSNLF
ncbi:hypothetical protein pdam_00003304 [Pocillopora damicornis]|uniref:RING-type E3 ubiquitin transferase n=1 Tax=Pocillopora damicornis TaxID=46731 RepID=A0A3M6TIC8_POCDA|nr:hypothetical protein pdam_00003304 [Pocillopora damicornis]